VRPWLYRIARNRSLNHLRKHTAIGVDSMDVHIADGGQTTAEKVHEREEFRQLIGDVQELPETQRTALLLREIDALSYEQIAEAMETTVPSVKSLLVRARVSLAEMSEARDLTCEEVREELGEVAEGLRRTSAPVRRHLRRCDRCTNFRKQLRATNKALAAVMPVGPLLLLKKVFLAHLGTTASAGGATAATTAATTTAAGAGSAGILSATVSTVASKAAAGITAAAIVGVGAVEVNNARQPVPHPQVAFAGAAPRPAAPPVAVAPAAIGPTTAEKEALAERRAFAAAAARAERMERAAAAEAALAAKAAVTEVKAEVPAGPKPADTGAAEAPAIPTGPAEQGVDTSVLPSDQSAGAVAAPNQPVITAPPNEEPAAQQQAPPAQQQQPQPQPQPEQQPQDSGGAPAQQQQEQQPQQQQPEPQPSQGPLGLPLP
jgi:hypothetical protein